MKYEIDFSTDLLIKDGKRYEPTGEARFITEHRDGDGTRMLDFCIILREVWTWPPTLGGWGFTRELNQEPLNIWWHQLEPTLSQHGNWYTNRSGLCLAWRFLATTRTDLTTPPPLKTGECLRNPNTKGIQ